MRTKRDYQRYARRGTTTERDLGSGHQSIRQTALAAMREGQLCARCQLRGIHHPMSRGLISRSRDGKRWVAPLLDLDDFPGRMLGGPQVKRLSHRYCNRSAGSRLRNRMSATARTWRTSRAW